MIRGQAFLIVVILQITTIKKARPLLAHNKKSQTPPGNHLLFCLSMVAKLSCHCAGLMPKFFVNIEQSITELSGLPAGVGYSAVVTGITFFIKNESYWPGYFPDLAIINISHAVCNFFNTGNL